VELGRTNGSSRSPCGHVVGPKRGERPTILSDRSEVKTASRSQGEENDRKNLPIAAWSCAFSLQPGSSSKMQQTTSDTPPQWEASTRVSRLHVASASIFKHPRHCASQEQASSSTAQGARRFAVEVAPATPASSAVFATSGAPAKPMGSPARRQGQHGLPLLYWCGRRNPEDASREYSGLTAASKTALESYRPVTAARAEGATAMPYANRLATDQRAAGPEDKFGNDVPRRRSGEHIIQTYFSRAHFRAYSPLKHFDLGSRQS